MMLIDAEACEKFEAALVAEAVRVIGIADRMKWGRAISTNRAFATTPNQVNAMLRRQAQKLDQARAAIWALRVALAQFEAAHPGVKAAADEIFNKRSEAEHNERGQQ